MFSDLLAPFGMQLCDLMQAGAGANISANLKLAYMRLVSLTAIARCHHCGVSTTKIGSSVGFTALEVFPVVLTPLCRLHSMILYTSPSILIVLTLLVTIKAQNAYMPWQGKLGLIPLWHHHGCSPRMLGQVGV